MRRSYSAAVGLACALVCSAACGDDGGGGDMNPPQESVSDGNTTLSAGVKLSILAGTGVFGLASDELADGWAVHYDKFLVTVGSIEFTSATGASVTLEQSGVVDLLAVPSASLLAAIEVPSGTSQVRFSMPGATSRFSAVAPASVTDLELMAKNGYSLYIEGTITRTDGHTCTGDSPRVCTPAPTVAFRWGVSTGVMYEDCPALDLEAGETVDQIWTLSGDHWFRSDFRDGTPTLRAQWIADADTDRDGEVTLDELERLEAAAVFPRKLGYDLRSGAPIPIVSARDFFAAQARMIGRDALGDAGGCKTSTAL